MKRLKYCQNSLDLIKFRYNLHRSVSFSLEHNKEHEPTVNILYDVSLLWFISAIRLFSAINMIRNLTNHQNKDLKKNKALPLPSRPVWVSVNPVHPCHLRFTQGSKSRLFVQEARKMCTKITKTYKVAVNCISAINEIVLFSLRIDFSFCWSIFFNCGVKINEADQIYW